jgi:hypothetical protein
MALDEKTTAMIKDTVAPIITSALAVALVGVVGAVLLDLVVTNYKSSDLTGDKEMHPTKDDVTASKVDASASETDAALSKDEAKGNNGDLSANSTDAAAMDNEAKALEGGAAAARTKAGAADIETKALKMT